MRLTPRETDVLVLLAKGFPYMEISRLLGVGLGTVQGHIKRLYAKLDVNNKAEAAVEATRRGLV
jgi:DNA-binding CsgD family transcriptional regulator